MATASYVHLPSAKANSRTAYFGRIIPLVAEAPKPVKWLFGIGTLAFVFLVAYSPVWGSGGSSALKKAHDLTPAQLQPHHKWEKREHPTRSVQFWGSSTDYQVENYSSYFVGGSDWWDQIATGWETQTFVAIKACHQARPNGWQLDSGAWIGPTVLAGAEYAAGVIAIEPDPRAHEMLAANVALNPSVAAKTHVHRLCLAPEPVTLTFRGVGASGSTAAQGVHKDLPTFPARCLPLRWLLEAHGVPKGGWALWKLDTEGAEADILPASIPVLEEWGWPIVHMSLHTPFWKDDPAKRAALLAAMQRYKYVYDGPLRLLEKLTEEHIKGFPEYTLSQTPLHFEAHA